MHHPGQRPGWPASFRRAVAPISRWWCRRLDYQVLGEGLKVF